MSPSPPRAVRLAPAIALLVCLAAALPAGEARAQWLPLAIGNEWTYMDEGDEPHVEAITELGRVRGRRMYVKSYTGGPDDGLLNFWALDSDGSVLLGGYYKPWYPFGLVYEPPVRIFPGSPVVGAEWTTHTVAYSVPDNVIYAEFDLYWRVQAQVTLVLQAGTFDAIGVGQVAPPAVSLAPDGQSWGLDGRVSGPAGGAGLNGPDSATEWYADGVGLVKYDVGAPFFLSAYNLVTPAVTSSWGRIKRLYR